MTAQCDWEWTTDVLVIAPNDAQCIVLRCVTGRSSIDRVMAWMPSDTSVPPAYSATTATVGTEDGSCPICRLDRRRLAMVTITVVRRAM